jgi:hypothetical protein
LPLFREFAPLILQCDEGCWPKPVGACSFFAKQFVSSLPFFRRAEKNGGFVILRRIPFFRELNPPFLLSPRCNAI